MARYIVIEVEDNVVAQELIDSFVDKTPDSIRAGKLMRVVGIFVRPGRTCECPDAQVINYRDPTKLKNATGGITRGEKFGWWVCSVCGKPRKGGHQLVNQIVASDTHEMSTSGWEMTVTGLQVGMVHKTQIDRPKKLRLKKPKKSKKIKRRTCPKCGSSRLRLEVPPDFPAFEICRDCKHILKNKKGS